MNSKIIMSGKLVFDPIDWTKKHMLQSEWKRIAMIMVSDDTCEYYAWFILKRYGLKLQTPIRGAHLTVVSDIIDDIVLWNSIKTSYNGATLEFTCDLDARTDARYWWMRVQSNDAMQIRRLLNIGDPYFGLHLTIGYPNERHKDHAKYVHRVITRFQ